jgi:hypothetical protein
MSRPTDHGMLYPDIRTAVRLLRGGSLVGAARETTCEESPC